MNSYQFAAIDIGSNAVRLLVSNVFEEGSSLTFKKQSLVRVPIRLGADAFIKKQISIEKEEDFLRAMKAFRELLDIYRPIKYRALATSAFREAENGPEIAKRVLDECNIDIEIISGKEEAEVIYANGLRDNMDADKNYLYMDVGGGSTELTLFKQHKAVMAKSFDIGSIRMLMNGVKSSTWDEFKAWIREAGEEAEHNVAVIGSGGNINKYCKLLMKEYGEAMTFSEIDHMYKRLKSMSREERIQKLYLNPDRADVIVPAGKIFTTVMKNAKAQYAYAPKIGVAEGVVKMLFNRYKLEQLPA